MRGKMTVTFGAKRAHRLLGGTTAHRGNARDKTLARRRERHVNRQALRRLGEDYYPVRVQRTGWDVA